MASNIECVRTTLIEEYHPPTLVVDKMMVVHGQLQAPSDERLQPFLCI